MWHGWLLGHNTQGCLPCIITANILEVKISTFVHRSCVLCGMDSVTCDQPHSFSCGFQKSSEVLRLLVFGAVARSLLLFAEMIYLLWSLCICVNLCRWEISVLGVWFKTAITSVCKHCFASVRFYLMSENMVTFVRLIWPIIEGLIFFMISIWYVVAKSCSLGQISI